MFFIGILIPYNHKGLLGSSASTASSPLTISLTAAGILPAANLINALIVVSVISAGNSSLYVSSRTLLYMSRNGKAPRFIGRTNKSGVPWVALIFSNIFACIVFLTQGSSAGTIYSALITLSGGTFCPTPNYRVLAAHQELITDSLNSGHVHRLVCNLCRTHPFPSRPRGARTRSFDATLSGLILSMGHIFRSGSQYLPRLLPRIHMLPNTLQRNELRDQLYLIAGVRVVLHHLQVLE